MVTPGPILLILAVLFQINGISKAALTVMPAVKRYCDYDAFISSTPYKGKVFLTPWKRSERRGDWYEARGYCASHCAELVTIHSAEENQFFLDFMRSTGLNTAVWLGAEISNKTAIRQWSNGEKVDYTNVAPGEYNEDGITFLCAAYVPSQNYWYNYYFYDVNYFIACQRPARWTISESGYIYGNM